MSDTEVEHSRPPPLHIPTEVCENIIDMLFSNDTKETFTNVATLHSCALVCRDWRVRAQRMLFYQVQLADTTSFYRLATILDNARHLRDYVYRIELAGHHLHNTASIFALFPAVFTGKLPKLFRIDVVHMPDATGTPFPRTPGPPKAKALPYIPLHPRFPAFLSAFTAVSFLCLVDTTFRTFSEFARMLHGLPNLSLLACTSVHWIAPGGSHPGADFTEQPEWAAGKDIVPPFAPNIRQLWVSATTLS
uniref:C3H1-type domain-containing protein n=1 Tax=Ganoderma boninense TaxID=34458 RepID=A0A5K1JZN2_9APHY|nr:C3H1-type domain-containing protein [Ganoderma boninense]